MPVACPRAAASGSGTAGRRRTPVPASGETNPPPFVKGSGMTPCPSTRSRTRRWTSSPTCSRSSTIPSSASSPCSVYQGTVGSDASCSSTTARSRSKVSHPFKAQEQGARGDRARGAATSPRWRRWRNWHFGRGAARQPRRGPDPLAPANFPVDVRPRDRGGEQGPEQKLDRALHKLAEEDRRSRSNTVPSSNETVIRGLSTCNLIMIERLKQRFGVEVRPIAAHRPS